MKCECGNEAAFFHSKCCNTNFEGKLTDEGPCIVCEECGKFVAYLKVDELLKGKELLK